MNPSIKLTAEKVEDIKQFINVVGDTSTASAILDIGKKTLEKYISTEDCIIPRYIWESKLRPVINLSTKNIYQLLIKRNSVQKKDNIYYRNMYIMKALSDSETIHNANTLVKNSEKIANSPLMYYMLINESNHEKLKELGKALEDLAENKEYDKYKLMHAMEDFAQIYELFRPNKIEQNSHYWGTVGLIDEIFKVLYSFLNTEPIIRFTKAFPSFEDTYHLHKKREYEQVDWRAIKEDVEIVQTTVIKAINEESIHLYSLIGKPIPYRLKYYICDYIKTYLPYLVNNDIEIKGKGIISIKGKDIFVRNEYCFFSEICKFDKTIENETSTR